ncbi:MAG TPA: hypothetical protein PLR20_14750 [Syntrophales bacterium]|nr:hypothetical protein [Syntrophales bacterium]
MKVFEDVILVFDPVFDEHLPNDHVRRLQDLEDVLGDELEAPACEKLYL